MIQEGTLIEAILGFRSQIDFLWQFFVTVHIAIFALLFIYDEVVESLNIIARNAGRSAVINGKAVANTYMLLDAPPSTSIAPSTARRTASGPAFSNTSCHSMAFIVIILAFLSREFVQTRKKGREAGASGPRGATASHASPAAERVGDNIGANAARSKENDAAAWA